MHNLATLPSPSRHDSASPTRAPAPDLIEACKILIIDDEPRNVRLLERILESAGFLNFVSTTDSRDAPALFVKFKPDLILTDWLMPEVDGGEIIRQLHGLIGADDYLPIVVLTADVTCQTRKQALTAGATDFLTKPFDQSEVLLRIRNLLRARLSHLVVQSQNQRLEETVRDRTIELERTLAELRNTQQQVIQRERLAALGTMAGGIAHDFNNVLSVIMGFTEILLHDAEDGLTKEQATPALATILTAAEDAGKIVRRLRDFYRPEKAEEERLPIDLNQLIEQAVELTRPRWQTQAGSSGRKITFRTELGSIPTIMGEPAELREMLTNLIFNAVDALPQGGAITIATSAEGETVALRLSDTGTGMTEDVRLRCLEPFFSTKGESGTGLGLAMVFGTVQRHTGTIEIESQPGEGTTFIVRFPPAEPGIPAFEDTAPASSAPMRILVVDDEPILCQLVCEHLQNDGHTAEVAFNGSDALRKFRTAPFDLVITDHVMSETTGELLALELKKMTPDLPVILLTGYAGAGTDGMEQPAGIDLVIARPLSRTALRHALAKVAPGSRLSG
jgi:signal transduction histidine kinase